MEPRCPICWFTTTNLLKDTYFCYECECATADIWECPECKCRFSVFYEGEF